MKVNFKHKTGRVQAMSRRDAEILQRLGRGSYLTRDLQAARPVESLPATDELDAMTPEELHELAKRCGVDVHHRAGADKVKEALRKAQTAKE